MHKKCILWRHVRCVIFSRSEIEYLCRCDALARHRKGMPKIKQSQVYESCTFQ